MFLTTCIVRAGMLLCATMMAFSPVLGLTATSVTSTAWPTWWSGPAPYTRTSPGAMSANRFFFISRLSVLVLDIPYTLRRYRCSASWSPPPPYLSVPSWNVWKWMSE